MGSRDPGGQRVIPCAGSSARIAQITDTHLEARAGGTLLGMDTDDSLAHVLRLLDCRQGVPDLVLVTGDVANQGSRAAYRRFRKLMDGLGLPWLWLPGNHDDAELMRECLGDGQPMVRSALLGAWQIVLLDSTIPREVRGRLAEREFELLDELLSREPGRPALVCLHHQPVPIGCAWLDEQIVENGARLLECVARHPQVRGLLWGHVHQEFQSRHGAAMLMASPSTCIQFATNSAQFRVDDLAPGMRWLELHPDGAIGTRIERVEGVSFKVDFQSSGYL